MRLSQAIALRITGALCALLLLVPGSWAKTRSTTAKSKKAVIAPASHSKATSSKSAKSSKSRTSKVSAKNSTRGKKTKKPRGQQAIDSDRTREIQSALIRERYMDGEPTGSFDTDTKSALAKFQRDNGWQTKVVPDSRALIKLGLGPSREGLLNPESAAISAPHELGMAKELPGGASPHK